MKVALITGANLWFTPYLNNYTTVLDALGVDYDIISWNRDGSDAPSGIQYTRQSDIDKTKVLKLFDFLRFVEFVKSAVVKGKYDRLVVFGSQVSVFLGKFLKSKYNGNYIIDLRDLSVEQIPVIDRVYASILDHSFTNVISSPGFADCIKGEHKFTLNHNFNPTEELLANRRNPVEWSRRPVEVLTIGGIRNFDSNSEVIRALSNKENFRLAFVGKGYAAKPLEEFASKTGCRNIRFEGYYPKNKEKDYIIGSSWINIFYPSVKSHTSSLSNRLYSSLIYKRPMIVSANSIHGKYITEYNLGLAVENTDNLDARILRWMEENSFDDYCARADALFDAFLADQQTFKEKVTEFCI